MSGLFNKLKTENVLGACAMIVIGVLLFIFPTEVQNLIKNTIAIVLVILGLVKVVKYFRSQHAGNTVDGLNEYDSPVDLIVGIVLIVLAGVVAWALVKFIPTVLGIIVLVSGLIKLDQAMSLKKSGGNAGLVMILALISVVFGILCIFHPSFINDILIQLIGVGLIYGGVSDLFTTGYVQKHL